MKLNSLKELYPVFYGTGVVKILSLTEHCTVGNCFSPHWHERMEILRVYSGELIAEIGQNKITVKKDEMAVIPPCRVHAGKSGEKGVAYRTVMFDIAPFYNGTPVSKKLLEPITQLKVSFLPKTANPQLLAVVDSIISLENKQDSTAALLISADIYKLIGLLYRHCLDSAEAAEIQDDRLKNVLDFINKNFLEDITCSSLCRKFGYSQGYFCRRFKAVTGISPSAYIRILRLEEAKRRLTDSSDSIGNIAAACGFQDLSYFSRCFKTNYGMTPSEYIKNANRHL